MYGFYYQTPIMNYVNHGLTLIITAVIAILLGILLFCTFFRKKNEGKYTGVKGKLYHLMNFNRFYVEDILRFLYIVFACCVTLCGIVSIVLGSFIMGAVLLVGGNLGLRIAFELLMLFIMLCRKTVSIDRRLSRIEKYYDDGYEEFCPEEPENPEETEEDAPEEGCSGICDTCDSTCGVEGLENFSLNKEQEE